MPRGAAVDLLAQLADEDVDRAVAVRGAATPDALQQLVPREHAPLLERERVEEAELGRRQLGARPSTYACTFRRVEPQLLDHDLLAAARILRAACPAGRPRRPERRAPSSRTASRGSRRRRSRARGRGRARCRVPRPRRSACRSPRCVPARSPSSRRARGASGRARRRRGARSEGAASPVSPFATPTASKPAAGGGAPSPGDDVVVLDDQHLRHLTRKWCETVPGGRRPVNWFPGGNADRRLTRDAPTRPPCVVRCPPPRPCPPRQPRRRPSA